MLPRERRLHRAVDFRRVLRSGRRAGQASLTLYACHVVGAAPARAGLVVSKAVGPSVVRHRVSRRLRSQLASRLLLLPAGTELVLRASPRAATSSSAVLGEEIDSALRRLGLPLGAAERDQRRSGSTGRTEGAS